MIGTFHQIYIFLSTRKMMRWERAGWDEWTGVQEMAVQF
jgi:hypothetical protein